MKWNLVFSKRTIFTYFTLLFLLYLLYALSICSVDGKKFTFKYLVLKTHITNYKSATKRLASFFGLKDDFPRDKYRRIPNLVPVKRLPDALIIGVKKCGTRALLEFLRLHPDVRAAGSEVHFFDRYYHYGFQWYRQRMPSTLEGQITMEKTPSYWVTRSAPKRVFAMNPAIKLLAVVRNPITRAISDYTQSASKRPFLPPFEELCLVSYGSTRIISSTWPPVRLGIYSRPFKRWLSVFPRESIHLINGERLVADPAAEMAKVQEFLGLKRVITEKHFFFNSTKGFPCLVKSESRASPHCLGKNKGRNHPHIKPEVIQQLQEFYKPHNEKFYEETGTNFAWN